MATQPKTVFLKDYQPPAFLIPRIELSFDLGEDLTHVTALLHFERNPNSSGTSALELDGEDLKVVRLLLDGKNLPADSYEKTAEQLIIKNPPARGVLEITTEIRPQDNKAFSGLYKTKKIFCTQMEAQGFRRMIYFTDRPDVLSIYTVTIRGDQKRYPFLLSNGEKISEQVLADGRHQVVWKDPYPKPCYLFALVAGDLALVADRYRTTSGREVALEIYTDKGNETKCDHAMESLKQSMKWDEDVYGLEYDLNVYMIVAVDDFNMGAMENKGLNIFNSKYVLADQASATDAEYMGIQSVIGHEYFHNWSGNRVTCRDWFQLSLKEGLTVFRDQEFTSDLHSRAVKRIEDVTGLRTRQFPEDASGMSHPVRPPSYIAIDNFYTRTVYDKGAEVIRMLQTLLGRPAFIRGVQQYFKMFDGQAVTTDDFIKAHELSSGKDLTQFKLWYDQAGTPTLRAQEAYDDTTQTYSLTIDQECVHPVTGEKNKPYHMPVLVGLLNADGREMNSQSLIEITRPSETFTFKNITEKPVASLLRGFSSPVLLEFEQSDKDLIFLMEKDGDQFNRFEAAQKLYKKVLLQAIDAYRAQTAPSFSPDILAAMKRGLQQMDRLDLSFLSRLLSAPSVSYVLQFCHPMEPALVEKAYYFFMTTVRDELNSELEAALKKLDEKKAAPGFEGAPRRLLRHVLLTYLTGARDEQTPRLKKLYDDADNMTDSMTALMLSAHFNTPSANAVIEDFAKTWASDGLVMNKWFSAQAMSLRHDALERVTRLADHPAFDITNPNKVFSLYVTFAMMNPLRFHSPDGRGYEMLTTALLDVDSRNPQVAARMATSFNDWTRWAPHLKTLAQKQLEKIHSDKKVSKNVFEIVDRALKMNKHS